MAIMYPKNIELYDATASEKKVYRLLENQLPDSFVVFYSVQWVDEENGVQKESECDFLIFSEQDGFLTCEVKGGRYYKKEGSQFILGEREGERVLKRSPMEQAEESSRYFKKLYSQEYNENFNGTFGSISIFPFYAVDDPVLLDHRPKDIVFDISDLPNLGKCIKKAFLFYKRKNGNTLFTKSQRINFKNLINKRIASEVAAGALVEAKQLELNSINRIQDNFIYFLKNYKRTFITGGAGTGKTWIALKFARQGALEGKTVLLTCSSQHLASLLRKMLGSYKNVDVFSFEELIKNDLGVKPSVLDNNQMFMLYEQLGCKKYNVVIVDEAQDFDQYQALAISSHLKDEDSEMRVFYDETQNVFDKDFKDGFDIHLPPFVLRENLRNTASIYDWAKQKTNLGTDVITNQVLGPIPTTTKYLKTFDSKNSIENDIIKLIDIETILPDSIVILCDHELYDEIKTWEQIGKWKIYDSDVPSPGQIRYSLVEDYKGLEANVVFYVHSQNTPLKYDYVAYTRAKFYLFEVILAK